MISSYIDKFPEKIIILIDPVDELEKLLAAPLLTEVGITIKKLDSADFMAVLGFPVVWLNYDLKDQKLRNLCFKLRSQKFNGFLLTFTGSFSETDKKQAFEVGLSDFFLKPFRLQDIIFQTAQIFSALDHRKNQKILIGPYTLQDKELINSDGSKRIKLTDKEVDILFFLFKNIDQSVSRERLLKEVWAYNALVTTHTLETHIYRLRQKIEPDPTEARFLCTTENGYILKKIFL